LADLPSFFSLVDDGLHLQTRVTPKAARNAIGDVVADGQGSGVLKVAVTAVPEKGNANAAVIALLAKSWKLRKSDIEVVRGATQRTKTILIRGGDQDLATRLGEILTQK
tara:strand:+ start:16116 stop:16442 length:327 start_codon:yes stop_codon:yes gene_type:complete